MKRLVAYLFCLIAAAGAVAQVNVTGKVVDKVSNEPLTGASVIVKGSDGKIRKFATSKADGGFALTVPSISGCRLEVSMMSFVKQSVSLDSVALPVIVYMEPGRTLLKEVTVKADRIREQGDTISYFVGSFAQKQDRSIGDVLKRMPGINVEKSGKIQYQGEDINKFYIEGSDLLGGKYGIATNGISHEDVGAVEVMENHQPMQVLSGIAFSDKAAINLKLKNKAKATWTFHGDAGGGYAWQPEGAIWDGEIFAMAVMPKFQNITTFKTNNIGEDLSAQAVDFFSSGRGTGLSRYVSVSMPGVPNLSARRTLFNRSALVSTNSLWKFGRGELKAQLDYSFNRVTADAASVTTYFLEGGDRVVTESRSGKNRSHSLSGKFIYELNRKTAFVNNTFNANVDWESVGLDVTGSLSNNQSASLPDYYVSNDFKMIKRINGKHLVTFQSRNEWESLPQTLRVTAGNSIMRQHVGNHAFHTNESAAYAFSFKGITVSLEAGVKGYLRSMNSELSGVPDLSGLSDGSVASMMRNVISTDYLTLYAVPKFEYWVRRVNIVLNAPVSYAGYRFDDALANRGEGYFSPSLSFNWKPNNRLNMRLRGSSGRSPMNLRLIHPGIVMTNYRTFTRGVDDFYTSSSQIVSGSVNYKHTRRGIFADAMVMQSWSHLPYTMAQQIYGDYIMYSYSSAKSDGKMLMASGNIGKTVDFMRGSANLRGSFSRRESHLLSENRAVNSVSRSWSIGGKINVAPLSWLSFDYRIDFSSTQLAMNGNRASWLGDIENNLLFNIMPHDKWEWHISGEHYRNELADNDYKNVLLLDTKVVYKLTKRLELSASLTNIFNERTYDYKSYNELSTFESRRWLRGRELLITISLRK